jgi:hypothetical protein
LRLKYIYYKIHHQSPPIRADGFSQDKKHCINLTDFHIHIKSLELEESGLSSDWVLKYVHLKFKHWEKINFGTKFHLFGSQPRPFGWIFSHIYRGQLGSDCKFTNTPLKWYFTQASWFSLGPNQKQQFAFSSNQHWVELDFCVLPLAAKC